MSKLVVRNKSYLFAIRIVKLAQYLQAEKKELVLSKQVLVSGTAIGALIKEAAFGQSKPDITIKFTIDLKEANESEYGVSHLDDTNYLDKSQYKSIAEECSDLIEMHVPSIKT